MTCEAFLRLRSMGRLIPPMFQICINPGMIAAVHEAGLGSADHHLLHYLSQTESHLIPKGQFEYAAQ